MAKKQYGLGHTRLTVPGRPDLTNKTAVVMVGDKTLEEALEEGGGEIFDEYIDATDQQRNTALANVSNQTANSTTGKMGYKVLEPTKTFAEQVTAENTIYEIRDVFDISGTSENPANITMPSNSKLRFEGGMLIGDYCTLTGNNTIIESDGLCIKKDITIGGTWSNETIFTKWFELIDSNDEYIDNQLNPNPTNNAIVFKQLQAMINGTQGCKVEFKKGYYQTSIIGTEPEGYVEIDGVTYEKWAMNTYQSDKRVVLNIFELPYLDINLNGSKIKGLRNTCPGWNIIRLNGVNNASIHDGELEGFAAQFDYPGYVNYGGSVTNNYEFSNLLVQAGGDCVIYNMYTHNSTGDGMYVGSGAWYYRDGTGLKSYPCNSYIVKDCEVSYCGRNGIVCCSSNNGTIIRTHIHHVGSDGSSGTIGTDGIMARSPRSGIDVEFEDGQGYEPIVKWDSLYFHDNGGKDFGFASGASSKMKSFLCTNSYIAGGADLNNIHADSTPVFDTCEFHINNAEGTLYGICTYNNCKIVIERQVLLGMRGEYENCNITIVDNLTQVFSQALTTTAKFTKCNLTFNSNPLYLQPHTYIDCVFNINVASGISVYGSVFKGCEFNNIVNNNYTFAFINNNPVQDVANLLTIEDCVFNNKCRGVGTDAGSYFIKKLNAKIKNTIFKEGLYCYYGSTGMYSLEMDNCIVKSILMCSPYNISGSNTIDINNCDIENLYIGDSSASAVDYSSPQIHINNSKVSIYNYQYYRPRGIVFNNVDFIKNDNYTDTYLTFTNSRLNFSVAAQDTSGYTLYNSLVSGAVTEAAFNGIAKDTIFMTPIPTHGDSSSRPAASSMPNTYAGFTYFDETLGMPLYLKIDVDTTDPDNPVYTKSWVKADGTVLS